MTYDSRYPRLVRTLALLAAVACLAALPAAAAVKAPFPGGQTYSVATGYNNPSPYSGDPCNVGVSIPDHCDNQTYGLDFLPPENTEIRAPIDGTVWYISGDCLGIRLDVDGTKNMTLCHFKTFDVVRWQAVDTGDRLGTSKGQGVHMSIDTRYDSQGHEQQYKVPVPFTGTYALEGVNFSVYPDNWENYHYGASVTSSNW